MTAMNLRALAAECMWQFTREEGCDNFLRPMPCPECGGDGGWPYPVSHDPFRDTIQYADMECRACAGSGGVDVEFYPIELEDISEFVS